MDDWKLRARVVVKLEKQLNMFVSSYRVRDVVTLIVESAESTESAPMQLSNY